jgi:hypothetical protein
MIKASAITATKSLGDQRQGSTTEPAPKLKVAKIGIVSRNYNHEYSNGFRDFSAAFFGVLKVLDDEGCDTVLFSPFSIVPRTSFRPLRLLRRFHHVKAVIYEEFCDGGGRKRKGLGCVVLYRKGYKWREYVLPGGGFPRLRGSMAAKKKVVGDYVRYVLPGRILGNCCVIICGETNGVPYHPKDGKVKDDFGLRGAIPQKVTVVLNPVHDWMSRFEMPLKRKFLSQKGRWVISVWNKGKRGKGSKPRDAIGDPWTVYHNRKVAKPMIDPNEIAKKIRLPPIDARKIDLGIFEVR